MTCPRQRGSGCLRQRDDHASAGRSVAGEIAAGRLSLSGSPRRCRSWFARRCWPVLPPRVRASAWPARHLPSAGVRPGTGERTGGGGAVRIAAVRIRWPVRLARTGCGTPAVPDSFSPRRGWTKTAEADRGDRGRVPAGVPERCPARTAPPQGGAGARVLTCNDRAIAGCPHPLSPRCRDSGYRVKGKVPNGSVVAPAGNGPAARSRWSSAVCRRPDPLVRTAAASARREPASTTSFLALVTPV